MAAKVLFDNLDVVERVLSRSPAGLVADIDGTISPIAPSPEEAQVSLYCQQQLQLLAGRLKLVAVLTGRSVADAKRLVGVGEIVYVGNHGLEVWRRGRTIVLPTARPYLPTVRAALEELRQKLTIPGLLFESKGVTASIHYRACREPPTVSGEPEKARRAILEAIEKSSSLRDLRISEGKMVVELRPPIEADKGTALVGLIKSYRLRALLYLGDDQTDLAAFRALREWVEQGRGEGLRIAVAGDETPPELIAEADLVADSVAEVERFLAWLNDSLPTKVHRQRPLQGG